MDARKSKCNDADIASESTCWQEASARLRTEHPQLHAQFEGPSGADLSGQIAQSIMDSQNRTVEKDPPAAWTHRAAHEKARVRRRAMDTILRAVTVFRDVGSAVANLDPSHVGIAWAGVNLILQLVLSGAEQNAAALQGLAHISPIITRYAKVEEIYMEQRRKHDAITFEKDFRAQVVKLYVGILVYQGTIIAHSKRHRIVQYARAVPKVDDWSTLLQDITDADAECRKFTRIFDSEEHRVRHWELKDILDQQDQQMEMLSRQIGDVHVQSEALFSHADWRENTEILDWVSTTLPGDDHTRILEHGKLNSDYANSGEWLFSRLEFQSWSRANDDSQPVLWLPGPVGTGKSSLMCLVIEQCGKLFPPVGKEAHQLAFFYFSRKQGTEEANSPKTLLRSLLRQLAWSPTNRSISPVVKEKYRQWQQNQGHGGYRLRTDDCIKLITQLISSQDHTKIIIDALDECSDYDELLSYLEEIISASQGKVKFLLSSRMHVPVQQTFAECARVDVGLDSKEDIEYFIETKIKQNQRRLRQCKAVDLEDRMIKTLSRRAQGMFQWVELQLDIFFSSKSIIRRRDVFERKLDRLEMESGMPELEEVYDEIYEMNAPGLEDRMVAERALKWIMCCRRPLNIEVFVKAVSLDSKGDVDEAVDADYILAICSNFIIIDHNQTVQFAHLSVREYLMSSARHAYTTADANTQAAMTSLKYLLSEGSQSDADTSKADGLLEYAALYWPIHCSLALVEAGRDHPLQQLIFKFLAPEEPSSGFALCLRIWAAALDEFDTRELHIPIRASLSQTNSPVFTACVWGFAMVVRAALSGGLDLNERNDDGDAALAVAASFNNPEIVRLLLEGGADTNAVGSIGGYTPLHYGVRPWRHGSSLEVVKLLVQHGADVSKAIKGPVNDGYTPLHRADHNDIVRFLLDNGARVNAQNAAGSTALHLVAGFGTTETARLLLESGAAPDLEDHHSHTALHVAATNGNEEMVTFLSTYLGLGSEAKKWARQARFYNAVDEGDEALVRRLVEEEEEEEGVDMRMRNYRGESPLHCAINGGHLRIASLLLEKGADIDATDKFGDTALLLACRQRQEERMGFLLDHGADINIKNEELANGYTALSMATALGEPQLVEMLLSRGANPQSVDVDSLQRERYVSPEQFEKALNVLRSHLPT